MRMSHYEQRPCLAVWTSPPSAAAALVPADFNLLVRRLKMGKGSLKRELLQLNSQEVVFQKTNCVRRSCIGLYLDDDRWPRKLKDRIVKGKHNFLYKPFYQRNSMKFPLETGVPS